jgi:hypothetical protein
MFAHWRRAIAARALALCIALMPSAALAQSVTVIGPITPGDCPQFSSTTVIKDSGFNCNGAIAVPFANPTGAVGLTGINGSANTAMRSDAAPPLSSAVQSALTGTNNLPAFGTGAFGYTTRALVGTDIPQINLAASGNGGVTGTLPNANLANPSVNGQTCTLGASCIIPTGAWKIGNLTAANDATNTSTQMDLNADWVMFYNPSTGQSITKNPPAGGGQLVSNLGCNISSPGPIAGGRDQSAAFVSTNVVW